ncbi:MAG TPA: AMP-binding protein, partial [Myxococcales bacterium]|nr:AMP-binding protein [Myxococcales bacterium]
MSPQKDVASLFHEATHRHAGKRLHFPALDRSITYGELGHASARVATALRAREVHPRERIGLLFSTNPEALEAFFGVLAASATPVPLPQPSASGDLTAYVARLARILRDGRIRRVLVSDDFEASARDLLEAGGFEVTIAGVGELLNEAPVPEPLPPVDPSQLALVQYTSGSTSEPKGVALTHANLLAGVLAISEGIQVTSDDVNGQWLPLHHDMGLIGLIAGVLAGVTHHLWSPASFIRHPDRWLLEFARRRATIYAGPSFSYASMLARVSDEQLRELDLSAWRVAFNGADTIDPACLEGFLRRFGAAGFAPSTMFPVYGLAEATLAVTFPPLGAPPAIDWVERSSAAGAGEVRALPAGDARARGIVSVGSAVLGHQVRVTGAGGQQLPSRQVGEIEVRGPAVMSAYFGRTPGDSGITGDGWLRTGDLGYLSQGRLFVTGRTKEMIVVRGVKLYPQDVEAAVRGLPGVYKRRAIAFSINGTRP